MVVVDKSPNIRDLSDIVYGSVRNREETPIGDIHRLVLCVAEEPRYNYSFTINGDFNNLSKFPGHLMRPGLHSTQLLSPKVKTLTREMHFKEYLILCH